MWLVENIPDDGVSTVGRNSRRLIEVLDQENIQYVAVKTIPFSHEFYVENGTLPSKPTFVYGSTMTVKAANKYCFETYQAPTENEVLDNLGDLYLNYDMKTLSVPDAIEYAKQFEYFFVKPNTCLKSFDGTITDNEKFPFFMERVMSYENFQKDDKICISSLKHVEKEWRLFIIDGEVVSCSRYMTNRKVTPIREYPDVVAAFATQVINLYNPNRIAVFDVCQLDTGDLKIVEFNTANCSGWYDNDISAIVKKINSLVYNQH